MFLFKKKEDTPKAPVQPKKNVQDVIKEQKETITQLQKKQEFIGKRIEQQEWEWREKAKWKNKNGALQWLKRKKLLEQQQTALDHQIITLETTVMQLENAQTNVITVNALQSGIKMQKELGKQMDIDNVDQMMDEMQELQDQQWELGEVWKRWVDATGDEDDLMKELEEMESDMLEQELLKTNAGPSAAAYTAPAAAAPAAAAPAAPAPAAAAKSKREEEDARQLAELQAQLNFA